MTLLHQPTSANTDKDLRALVADYYTRYYRDTLGLPDWQRRVENRLDEEDTHESVHWARAFKGRLDVHGRRFLNVGCGTGGMNLIAARQGMESHGVELADDALAICRRKAESAGLPASHFLKSKAETLPHADASFDIVYCLSVLEHVQDVGQAVKEMVRVTRPGGIIYISAPNYLSFSENHYKVFWLPLLPKPIARLYLSFRGRPSAFIDTLNYTTPRMLKRLLRNLPVTFEQGRLKPNWHGPQRAFLKDVAYRLLGIQPCEFWIRKV